MTTIPLSTSSTTPETRLHNDSTDVNFDPEIMAHFISRGFQQELVSSFLKREAHLDLKSNSEIMFDFLQERQYNDPTIFIGVEGTDDVESGEDKNLLVKWGLTEEAASELRNSVLDDALWSKQILYHWLFEWILNPWGSFSQMGFYEMFYDEVRFPRNEWNSYERSGGPQMFASSYEEIATRIDDYLRNNTKVTNFNSINTTYRAFYHATNHQSAQSISKNGIKLIQCKHSLDFGSDPSFYLLHTQRSKGTNPSINNAIDWIKHRKGFNGIVVYWVDTEKTKYEISESNFRR